MGKPVVRVFGDKYSVKFTICKKNINVASVGERALTSHLIGKNIRKLDQCPLQIGGFMKKSTPDKFLTQTLMDISMLYLVLCNTKWYLNNSII